MARHSWLRQVLRPCLVPQRNLSKTLQTFRRNGLAVVRKFATDDVVDKLTTHRFGEPDCILGRKVSWVSSHEHVQYDDVSLRGTLKQTQQVQSKSVS